MSTFYKWVKGENFGRVEKTKETDDLMIYFESGNRIYKELVGEFLIETVESDTGIEKQVVSRIIPDVPQSERTQLHDGVQTKIPTIDIDKYNKLVQLCDNKEQFTITIEIPDKKTLLLADMFGVDIQSIILHIITEKAKEEIEKISTNINSQN